VKRKGALNLTHSPENGEFWGVPILFIRRRPRGECDTDERRANPPGRRQHRAAQRQAITRRGTNQGSWESYPQVPEYLVQCKKRARDGSVASDGEPVSRNGVAKRRLTPAERSSPRWVARERRNTALYKE